MKKILIVLFAVCILGGVGSGADIPNLEASMLYDLESSTLMTGFTSQIISYKDIDVRVGYTSNKYWIASLSYNLANLEKLGANIKYAWGSTHLNFGGYLGYNFETSNLNYGLLMVMIQVNF